MQKQIWENSISVKTFSVFRCTILLLREHWCVALYFIAIRFRANSNRFFVICNLLMELPNNHIHIRYSPILSIVWAFKLFLAKRNMEAGEEVKMEEKTDKKQNNALLGGIRKVEHSSIDAFNYRREYAKEEKKKDE